MEAISHGSHSGPLVVPPDTNIGEDPDVDLEVTVEVGIGQLVHHE